MIDYDTDFSLDRLLPHSSSMLLLDRVAHVDDDQAIAEVTLSAEHLFADEQGRIPTYFGMELMAQTIGVWSGNQKLKQHKPVYLGFLLGSRKFEAKQAFLPLEQKLTVLVKPVLMDEDLGLFSCELYAGDKLLATSEVKAIQPDDEAMLESLKAS